MSARRRTRWASRNPPPARLGRYLYLCLYLLLCLGSQLAFGWSAPGHELAGDLTERYLTPQARSEIRKLLGSEELADASTWADRMRSNPAPYWQKEAGAYHYVDVPPGQNYRDRGPPPQGDAISALTHFSKVLRDPDQPRAQRQLALRFALHIVQDLHQPLHVGNGRDRGGNQVKLSVLGEPSNLHRLWDRDVPGRAGLRRERWARSLQKRGLLREPTASDADPLVWLAESAALRDQLYPPPRTVDAAYLDRWRPIAEQRLALAGIRSAAWLNAQFAATADGETAGQELAPVEQRSWWQRLWDRIAS